PSTLTHTLSLHDALRIYPRATSACGLGCSLLLLDVGERLAHREQALTLTCEIGSRAESRCIVGVLRKHRANASRFVLVLRDQRVDRKSTRLNSSHVKNSY